MRGLVVYESMFGNTRLVAEAIAEGLGEGPEMRVRRAVDCMGYPLTGLEILVAGAPTHAHSMPRIATRRGAPTYAHKPGSGLSEEPGAASESGVREWLGSFDRLLGLAAAFDTRVTGPAWFTGRASRSIARGLQRHGLELVLAPESFLVDRRNHLVPGELERARRWGAQLAEAINTSPVRGSATATS
jgi:hypothetical protein